MVKIKTLRTIFNKFEVYGHFELTIRDTKRTGETNFVEHQICYAQHDFKFCKEPWQLFKALRCNLDTVRHIEKLPNAKPKTDSSWLTKYCLVSNTPCGGVPYSCSKRWLPPRVSAWGRYRERFSPDLAKCKRLPAELLVSRWEEGTSSRAKRAVDLNWAARQILRSTGSVSQRTEEMKIIY